MSSILQHTSLESFRKYIGISYGDYDCYEIIQLYYKEVLEKSLDDLYAARPSKLETESYISNEKSNFLEVNEPELGDIIVFRIFGLPCHVGMYVNEDIFFHSREYTDACLEKLSVWKKRVVGYYRWP